MGSEWKKYSLKEITKLIVDCPHSTPKWTEKGVIVIRNQNIRNGKLDLTNPSFTDEQGYQDRIKRAIPKENDLVFTREAPMGEICKIPKDLKCCLGQRMVLLRVDPNKIDSTFLLYEMQSTNLKHQISWNEGTGTTVSNIRIPNIKAFRINVPPLPEQKAIAHILGSLDDKIELNRQMNQTLEQMAQALFKSWFVDFDPVIDNALAAGNEIPEPLLQRAEQRQELGNKRKPLPANIQDLFPAEFEFSEELDKWVPKGWKVGNINDVAQVIGGGTPSTKQNEYYCVEGIAWLSPKDLSGYEWKFISRGARDITDLGLAKSSAKLMPEGTVLFSSRAPIGYVAIAENEISTNQGFKSLVPKTGMCSEYLYYFLKTNVENIEAIATGSTFKEVSGNAIKSFEILIPSTNILDVYKKSTDDYNFKRLINQKEVQALTKQRDILLPKLVSGEVRVPEYQSLNA